MIEPMYFTKEGTPLLYYDSLKVFSVIWLVTAACSLPICLITIFIQPSYGVLFTLEAMINLAIRICVVVGLYRSRWDGVIALYCMSMWGVFNALIDMLMLADMWIDVAVVLSITLIRVFVFVAWGISTWIYFSKRRPLFAPYDDDEEGEEDEDDDTLYAEDDAIYIASCENTKGVRTFCRECGEELLSDSKFCCKCGTRVVVNSVRRYDRVEVCIFDAQTGNLRKELRYIDLVKIPPERFSENNMYYAIEKFVGTKKIIRYYEKEHWNELIESSIRMVDR